MATRKEVRKVTVSGIASKTRIQKYLFSDRFTDAQRAAGEARVLIGRIYGTVVRYRAGMSDNGEFIKFDGNLRSVDMFPDGENGAASGEVQNGGTGILPNFLNGPLMAAIDTTKAPVSFSLQVSAKYDASAVTSYVFEVENLLPAQPQSDPLLALEQAMEQGTPLLSAPTPTQEPAADVVPAKTPAPAPAAAAKGRK